MIVLIPPALNPDGERIYISYPATDGNGAAARLIPLLPRSSGTPGLDEVFISCGDYQQMLAAPPRLLGARQQRGRRLRDGTP